MNDELCLLDIVKYLSVNGQYLAPSWFNCYQILVTLPIGSNECERSFSALQRIKTKLRNSLSRTALETAVKFSILKLEMTDDDLDDIVKHFCMYLVEQKLVTLEYSHTKAVMIVIVKVRLKIVQYLKENIDFENVNMKIFVSRNKLSFICLKSFKNSSGLLPKKPNQIDNETLRGRI